MDDSNFLTMSSNNSLVEFAAYASRVLGNFIERVHEELDIPLEILKEIIDKECADTLLSRVVPVVKKAPIAHEAEPDDDKACIALIKTGARKGDNCGGKISKNSATGMYCGRHIKFESAGAEEKSAKKSLKNKGPSKEPEGEIVFRRNKWGYLAYGSTGLILKSDEEKVIIGKQLKEEIEDLTEEDIALCKMKKFRFIKDYSKTLVKGE